jgi:hypothetical protein
MERFANAGPPLGGDTGWPALFWIAGLLEGEGTFLRPVPSSPASPILSCRMTDRDVVELAARAFGTSMCCVDKGRYKTEFVAAVKGARAAELMRLLHPMMSTRRQRAIDRALRGYRPPVRKLNFALAEEIRSRRVDGETISSLARSFLVSRPTIRAVLSCEYYRVPESGSPCCRSPASFAAHSPLGPDSTGRSFTGSRGGSKGKAVSRDRPHQARGALVSRRAPPMRM